MAHALVDRGQVAGPGGQRAKSAKLPKPFFLRTYIVDRQGVKGGRRYIVIDR